jgi:uncharacterized protein (DUF433 family)
MSATVLTDRIVQTDDICGGQARINGTRIRVRDIVNWIELQGQSADEIAAAYKLELADIYLTMAYYHANIDALQQQWAQLDADAEAIMQSTPSKIKQ